MQHKLEHIIIIVKENHTFDNYFGRFPGANGDPHLADAPNPPASDHPHTHEAWLQFDTKAVKEQYTEHDLSAYWKLAREFTLCDHYFTDVAGPSTPNHLMLIAADSPVVDNIHESSEKDAKQHGGTTFALPSLPIQLEKAGLSWKNYGGYAFQYIKELATSPHTVSSEQFVKDAQAGNLPAVSWLYAGESSEMYGNLSEHPPANVTPGMEWTISQLKALIDGGLWERSAVFITWDDWGGWYDHVTPPEAEKWHDGTQFRYGPRVPCLVVGPYAKAGHISHKLHSHVSIVRFCEDNFGLPPLNQRAKATNSLTDCFDFTQTPLAPPKL